MSSAAFNFITGVISGICISTIITNMKYAHVTTIFEQSNENNTNDTITEVSENKSDITISEVNENEQLDIITERHKIIPDMYDDEQLFIMIAKFNKANYKPIHENDEFIQSEKLRIEKNIFSLRNSGNELLTEQYGNQERFLNYLEVLECII